MDEQTKRKINLKIYPIYKMFAWDMLFYYAIVFIFVNQVKGLSASTILFIGALYYLFKIVFEIFCITIVDHIGKRKSLIFGNMFLAASTLALIVAPGVTALLICNILMSFGFVLKELSEDTLLSNSIPTSEHKPNIFSKIDGKGSTFWLYLDAVSSIVTGFLFVVNAYLPMIMSLIFSIAAILISFGFQSLKDDKSNHNSSEPNNIGQYMKDLRHAFKFIFKSKRLKALLMFSALWTSFGDIFNSLKSVLLIHLNFPAKYFGIVAAVGQMLSATATKKLMLFHEKLRNRSLTWFSLPIAFSLILASLTVICSFNIIAIYTFVFAFFVIYYIAKGPYQTLIKRYFNSFSTPEINTKIYTAKSLLDNLAKSAMFFFSSFLFGLVGVPYALLIIGCVLAVLYVLLLDYMKTRLGLKPEEYDKKDIEFNLLK